MSVAAIFFILLPISGVFFAIFPGPGGLAAGRVCQRQNARKETPPCSLPVPYPTSGANFKQGNVPTEFPGPPFPTAAESLRPRPSALLRPKRGMRAGRAKTAPLEAGGTVRHGSRSAGARLKDDFCGRHVHARGHAKVFAQIVLGVLAPTINRLRRHMPRPSSFDRFSGVWTPARTVPKPV